MEVGVRVEAENAVTGEVRHTSSAYLTMVAVDEHGEPKQVPPLIVEAPTRSAASARQRHGGATASPSATRSSPTAKGEARRLKG